MDDKFESPNVNLHLGTVTPLINISPISWGIPKSKYSLLIQLQGNKLKLYCHRNGKESTKLTLRNNPNEMNEFKQFGQNLVKQISDLKILKNGEFKNKTIRDSSSYYIYQTLLIDKTNEDVITLDYALEAITSFYSQINNILNKIYPN